MMKRVIPVTVLGCAWLMAACSNGSSTSPLQLTAPSPALQADSTSGGFAVQAAKGGRPGKGSSDDDVNVENESPGHGHGHGRGNSGQNSPQSQASKKVELEGIVESVDPVTLTFVVNGVTVSVTQDTVIRHGGTRFEFGDIVVGGRVHVRGVREGEGDVVVAREVKLQNDGTQEDDEAEVGEHEVSGLVTGFVAGPCPDATFTIGTTNVVLSSSTLFGIGVSCETLADGTSVEVEGTLQVDGVTLNAVMVKLDDE